MKSLTFLIIFTLVFSSFLCAQKDTAGITGLVLDKVTSAPLQAATVTLLKSTDSSVVDINTTDSIGRFKFTNLSAGKYVFRISSSGFSTISHPEINVLNGQQISAGTFYLSSDAKLLSGITIQAVRPFIERKIDKTVINVEASITSAGTNALELLEQTPGVSVDKDGNVSLKGKPGVQIMIDGKPSYLSGENLSNLLRNMSSSAIAQIEIMTNPPAKYDAAGNSGIINIRMKRNRKSGLNGSLSSSLTHNVHLNTDNSLNLNYSNHKVNLFGNYSYSYYHRKKENTIYRKFYSTQNDMETIFDQKGEITRKGHDQNFQAGIDFKAGDNTTIGMVLSGYVNPGFRDGLNTTTIKNSSGLTDSIVLSQSTEDDTRRKRSINLNFRHLFDSTGKEITIDMDQLDYGQKAGTLLVGNYYYPDYSGKRPSSYLKGSLPSDISIYSVKTDLVFPLKKNARMEAGLKSSFVATDNEAQYKTLVEKEYVTDNGKSNHFLYKENIYAAYVNYSKTIDKWGFQMGLRAEKTHASGNQKGNSVQADSSFVKDYTSLFPTVYISYSLNKRNNFSINYGRRTDRPAYQDLNPFYYFIDEYTYGRGNTLLQPQFSNNFEFSYSYKNLINATVNYSQVNNAFTQVLRQTTSERKTYQTTENLAVKTNYGLALSGSIPVVKGWKSDIYLNGAFTGYNGELGEGQFINNKYYFLGNMTNRFDFGKGWGGELNGFYHSGLIEGQIGILPSWRIDAGIQKRILKDKGSVKISYRDLFQTNSMVGFIQYHDIDLHISHKVYSTARLTFTYRFGKPAKNGQSRKVRGVLEEQGRIK